MPLTSNQRIIIFDGPDMCGKTAIAKELSRQTGIPYFKASSEHQTFLKDCENFRDWRREPDFLQQLHHADPRMLDFLKQTGHSVIFDRAYPSEVVYSTLFHRQTDLDAIVELDKGYEELDAQFILCVRNSYDGIHDDLKPDMGPDVLREQHELYMDFFKATRLRSMTLYTDDQDLPKQIASIRNFLEV